jgi:hypothetical protein
VPDARQLAVKIALAAGEIDQAALIPIFHKWIQERRIDDQLLIDVFDYRHVHEGPGVMLIAHEAHYGLDSGGGITGLRYAAKRDEPGPLAVKLREALRRALTAAVALEGEPSLAPAVRFDTGRIEIEISDRLCEVSAEQLGAAAREVLGDALGALEIAAVDDERLAPRVVVAASTPIAAAELLAAL